VRNFFGLPIEKFHQPCAAWHRSGHHIYAAAAYGQVYVFHVGSTKARPTTGSPALCAHFVRDCFDLINAPDDNEDASFNQP
jgi:hypothetical protein